MTSRALPRAPSSPLPPLSRLLVDVALMLADWDAHRRSRRALGRLDAHLLRDIGLSPDHVQAECAKPFWRD